ncbi:MAG: hypothetical protein H6835_20765 [Planctomycetes bacterium]|nr:hypothetical protein [Planctomycetota bacterium]
METKRRGRPPAAGEARTEEIRVRATPAELRQFTELGGADWLRRALRAAYRRLTKGGKPPPA